MISLLTSSYCIPQNLSQVRENELIFEFYFLRKINKQKSDVIFNKLS